MDRKRIVRSILSCIIMQILIMTIHLFMHKMEFNDKITIVFSFVVVALITYLAVLFLKLPIYAIFSAQIVAILFILIFEDEGVYLLYYLHQGQDQWFNPDIYTDTVIIVLEMLAVQLPSAVLAKLTGYVYTYLKNRT